MEQSPPNLIKTCPAYQTRSCEEDWNGECYYCHKNMLKKEIKPDSDKR